MLYACFGLGAALGAVSVGTVFAQRVEGEAAAARASSRSRSCSRVFALLRVAALAYPVALLLGYAYFVVDHVAVDRAPAHLDDEERGRVMALWIMGFGGTVPARRARRRAGSATSTSITAVLLAGAVWAVVLAAWSNASIAASEGSPRCLNRHAVAYHALRVPTCATSCAAADPRRDATRSRPRHPSGASTTCSRTSSASPTTSSNGRLDGIATDPWTAGPGRRARATRRSPSCSPSGTSYGPQFEALLAALPTAIAGQAVFDAVTHEADMRHALARPGERTCDGVAISFEFCCLGRTAGGLPALRVVTDAR